MPFPDSALWDIVELEAVEKYYIWSDKEKRFAEKPAITINTGFTLAPDAKANENYTVYFGEGLGHWSFKSIKKSSSFSLGGVISRKNSISESLST